MARDYKHRKRPAKRKKGTSSFGSGLTIGLAIALIVHLYHLGKRPEAEPVKAVTQEKPAAQEPEATDDSDIFYDFYEMLPDDDVFLTEETAPGTTGRATPASTAGAAYYLQAGSFRNHADADSRKANLALLGVSANIQRVTINDNQTWHRVLVGPINDATELSTLRTRLGAENIDTMMLRAKESP